MFKLMKYEFRKQIFSKFIMLFLAALLEVYFFIGFIQNNQHKFEIWAAFFMFLAFGSILFVSFECIITYSNDLKTKCSYLLFMTPHSSYTIIGAKALATALQILVTSAIYVAVFFGNFVLLVARYDQLANLVDYIKRMFDINLTGTEVITFVAAIVIGWISIVLFAFLAITISSTFLANKKGKGFVSFILFFLICYIYGKVTSLIVPSDIANAREELAVILIAVVFASASYFATAYMLERKVSL